MSVLGTKVRAGFSALGLICASASGLVLGAVVLAPPALAQKAAKPPKVSKEYGVPINEALAALNAKDFATALAKADLAAPHAQTPQEKLTVEQIRMPALASLGGDRTRLLQAVQAAIATGAASPEDTKRYKSTLGGLYTELGDTANAYKATKAYVDEFGGTAQQYAYLMSSALKDKVYPDAQTYGQKALSQARTEGKVPDERWHGLVIRAFLDGGDIPGYLAAIEAAYADYPKPEYLRAIAQQAEKAPKFNSRIIGLDIFRSLAGAGVALSDREKISMGDLAVQKALPIEAEAILKPMIDSGAIGGSSDPQADVHKKLYAQAQSGAKSERAGGLASSEAQAAKAATGSVSVLTGEAFIGAGDYAKAVALLQSGLAKGGLNDGEAALAKLHLGMAQLKAGDKENARKTFADIKADNGASELARLWLIAAKK